MACFRLELVPPAGDTECPYARSGHRLVIDEGNLYVLGGYNPDVVDSDVEDEEELRKRIFVQMWQFNFFSRQWKELGMTGEYPQCLASHSATLHGNTMFTYGGSGIPFGIVSSRDVHVCRLEPRSHTVTWSRLDATGDIPEKKYGHSQVMEWPYFYVVGGTTGYIYNTDVHRLDLRTCVWTCLFDSHSKDDTEHPIGRYRHEVVLYNNRILMIGGGQAVIAYSMDKVPYFDLASETWEEYQTTPEHSGRIDNLSRHDEENHQIEGFPPARRCHSCVQHKNAAYIFGGRNEDEVLGDLWRLCLDTFQWSCIVPAKVSPVKCFFHSAAVTASGCMYVFGGVTIPSNETRINDVYKIWLTVPTLQEMAWSAISRRLHHCRSSSLQLQLMEAGVPWEFTQRVLS